MRFFQFLPYLFHTYIIWWQLTYRISGLLTRGLKKFSQFQVRVKFKGGLVWPIIKGKKCWKMQVKIQVRVKLEGGLICQGYGIVWIINTYNCLQTGFLWFSAKLYKNCNIFESLPMLKMKIQLLKLFIKKT